MTQDLRRYSRQTTVRSLIFFVIILFVVGDGLIYLFYGKLNAIYGALCMTGGLGLIGLVFLLISILGWIAKGSIDE